MSSSSRAKSLSQQGRDLLARAAQGVVSAPAVVSHTDILAKLSMTGGSKRTKEAKMWTEEEDLLLRRAIERYGEDWPRVVEEVPGRNKLQCVQRWKKTLKPGLTKGPWKPEEDALLVQVMSEEMEGDWQAIAKRVPGRNAKQCKERWTLNLNPSINHGPWTPEEDAALVQLHSEIGGKWSILAKRLTGRTEHSIKTRFLSLQRQAAKVRGWTLDEDRTILKQFMLAPNLDGTAAATKALTGRTKKQVMQRWAYLREQYVSIDDLATSSSQGQVNLTEQDLEMLIPGSSHNASAPTTTTSSAYSGSAFSPYNSDDSHSSSTYNQQQHQQERVKSLARRHGSSTPSQPFRPLAKKLEKSHASSSSSASNPHPGQANSAAGKAALGGEILNAAYASSFLEPLSSILESQASNNSLKILDNGIGTTPTATTAGADPFIAGLEKTLARPSSENVDNKFASVDSSIADLDFSIPSRASSLRQHADSSASSRVSGSASTAEPQRTLKPSGFSSFVLPPIGGGPPSPEPLSNRSDSLLALVSELDQYAKSAQMQPSPSHDRQPRFSGSNGSPRARNMRQSQPPAMYEYTPRADDMMRAFSSFAPEISGGHSMAATAEPTLAHTSSFIFGSSNSTSSGNGMNSMNIDFARGLSNSDLNIAIPSSGIANGGHHLASMRSSYSPQMGVGEDDKRLRKFASSLGGLEPEMFDSVFN